MLGVCRFHAGPGWAGEADEPLHLLIVTGLLHAVLVLAGSVVPDTVEELLLRGHDLGELARLLLEVGLCEELLDLLAEVAEQEGVQTINAEAVGRAVSREQAREVRMGLSLVTVGQREVVTVGRDKGVGSSVRSAPSTAVAYISMSSASATLFRDR